ncbi:unnamed protein product [Cuscuta campestris]|uniref:Phytocyanin domain-containing protein n=1 Tax=Cuscuta campestris TaxID=132261 RepID=A0A484KHC5_9ASTE|nr:unnamed protein product [Cuscuta campestris]
MARKCNMALIVAAVVAVAATLLYPLTAQPTAAPTPSAAASGGVPQTYTVGDYSGWIIPRPGEDSLYQTWVANKTFKVGDSLVFNFTTGRHNVAEVSRSSFNSCSTTAAANTTGPVTIRIRTTGEHYYICTVGPHCSLGQKLAINVSGEAAGPAATPPSAASSPPPPSVAATPVSGPDVVPSGQSPAAQPSTAAPSAALAALPVTLFSVALLALLH